MMPLLFVVTVALGIAARSDAVNVKDCLTSPETAIEGADCPGDRLTIVRTRPIIDAVRTVVHFNMSSSLQRAILAVPSCGSHFVLASAAVHVILPRHCRY